MTEFGGIVIERSKIAREILVSSLLSTRDAGISSPLRTTVPPDTFTTALRVSKKSSPKITLSDILTTQTSKEMLMLPIAMLTSFNNLPNTGGLPIPDNLTTSISGNNRK
jgi:hypothetical protein